MVSPTLAVVVGLVLLESLVFAAALLVRRSAAPPAERDGVDGEPPGETVACPECGTHNEPGYRFCRSCVAVLPGSERPSDAEAASWPVT